MPVQYTSIIDEHTATRTAVAITDISHMGRLRFEGPGAAVFLAELLTRRVADMELGQIRYSLVTNDEGGILDDVLVGYYHDSYGQPFYVVVVNAGNRQKIVDWIQAHLPRERAEIPGREVIFTDLSRLWAMFAIQGPKSVDVLQPLVNIDLQWMRYYRGTRVQLLAPRRPPARRHHQPHRLHRRRRFRIERGRGNRPGHLAGHHRPGPTAGHRSLRPGRGIRSAWRRECRCMATN